MSKTLNLVRRIVSYSTSPRPAAILSPTKLSLSSSLFKRLQFSSHTHSSNESSPEEINPAPSNHDLPNDVSSQELKQRIEKYLQGDMDAVPSIFEAILARKLSGNHEDTDDEIMEEFRSETRLIDDSDFASEESDEALCESDEELSD